MKVLIIARDFTSEDAFNVKPRIMYEKDGEPLLLKVMKKCALEGYRDFIICTDESDNAVTKWLDVSCLELFEKWRINVVKTPSRIKSAGCIKYAEKYLDDGRFFYIDIGKNEEIRLKSLLNRHKEGEYTATLTAKQTENGINSMGIGVFEPEISDYIKSVYLTVGKGALERIAEEGDLGFYIT